MDFLQGELPLILGDVSVYAKLKKSLQYDDTPPRLDLQVIQYLNWYYGGHKIGRRGLNTWPPCSPETADTR